MKLIFLSPILLFLLLNGMPAPKELIDRPISNALPEYQVVDRSHFVNPLHFAPVVLYPLMKLRKEHYKMGILLIGLINIMIHLKIIIQFLRIEKENVEESNS